MTTASDRTVKKKISRAHMISGPVFWSNVTHAYPTPSSRTTATADPTMRVARGPKLKIFFSAKQCRPNFLLLGNTGEILWTSCIFILIKSKSAEDLARGRAQAPHGVFCGGKIWSSATADEITSKDSTIHTCSEFMWSVEFVAYRQTYRPKQQIWDSLHSASYIQMPAVRASSITRQANT